jgi:hypothetical protein
VGDFDGKMGICGAFWREAKLMEANYPSCGRHRGPARCFAHFCFVRSLRARLEKLGMVWTRRMDKSSNLNEKKTKNTTSNTAVQIKKMLPGAESTADALTFGGRR